MEPPVAPWARLYSASPPFTYLQSDRDLPPDWARGNCTPQEKSDHAGMVGLFEGARYRETGWWRSAITCRMRETADPFCPQCQQIIRGIITNNS